MLGKLLVLCLASYSPFSIFRISGYYWKSCISQPWFLLLLFCVLQVLVLEAKDRIGGRVWDDKTFKGITVGKGAQIVNGCVNNPIALMCEQVGLHFYRWKYCSYKSLYTDPCKHKALLISGRHFPGFCCITEGFEPENWFQVPTKLWIHGTTLGKEFFLILVHQASTNFGWRQLLMKADRFVLIPPYMLLPHWKGVGNIRQCGGNGRINAFHPGKGILVLQVIWEYLHRVVTECFLKERVTFLFSSNYVTWEFYHSSILLLDFFFF